ncbi:PLP-dependent aminotransferase family protein [Amylibacter sp. SFDW26]|uniref:aminotransferase-like domain-containing protein n=1 Tax=Amylibacter sp. SFDW26 TaxID=2652722 RepID=UPI0012621D99|nr:PLP-dependent aminotransferase family protein [Amylibacter sp. SFDW26]KAB7613653.1 PLP-dependent aminotransferase family protein [Amylibacter sp. SFDW26]
MGTIWQPTLSDFDGPKYKAVVAALRSDIAKGTLEAGAKLPPVRDLAWDIGVTPGTVARAYKEGISEGLLQATVGRGTFVAGKTEHVGEFSKTFGTVPDQLINLRNTNTTNVGQAEALQRAIIKVGQAKADEYLYYPERDGRHAIYPHLAKWMEYSNVYCNHENLVVTNGGQNAIGLACAAVLSDGIGAIALDALTYPGIRYAVQGQRADLLGVKTDEFGIIPEHLETVYKRKPFKALFTSCNVLNPTTGEMPLERRLAIANLARRYDFQVIEDDCWGIGPAKVPSFINICPERAWYLSSFSKSVSAGLRFGYLLCPDDKVSVATRLMQTASFGVSGLVTDVAAELLTSGDAATTRRRVLETVSKRVEYTVNRLGKWDISWRRDVPFIWLQLPRGWRASSFTMACERESIIVRAADEFALNNMPTPHAVRISLNSSVPIGAYGDALTTIDRLLSSPPMDVDT